MPGAKPPALNLSRSSRTPGSAAHARLLTVQAVLVSPLCSRSAAQTLTPLSSLAWIVWDEMRRRR